MSPMPTPLLAIDAGNSRIKWGIHDGRGWGARGGVPTAGAGTLGQAWREAPTARAAIASNVAGPGVEKILREACADLSIELRMLVSPPRALGVVNGYREPAQLGPDRWAALVAAQHAEPGHKLVVNVGTALTIDALRADGHFLGGVIVPGPALMRRSLDSGTAGLRLTEGEFDELPKGTADAITTGALRAAVGAILGMRDAMARQGAQPRRAVMSGGAAGEVAPRLPMDCVILENLVLDGLVRIAREGVD
ncbi:MAG TPA: type III pantothenate kinase [Usitatibacter sp.]|nr:type III pantothenate kinase [Usitatibacter sp.]